MLFALALIPVIGLLVFIYFNDKNEKEPFGLLVALFFAGMGTIVSALILEGIGEAIINAVFGAGTVFGQIAMAMLVVGPAEELGKFLILRLITWKNKHFNYSYDAIVYAVFVSMGFAAFENVGYVFTTGFGTAIGRMFTAVPGHACFAVFMGFFYSKAKYAAVTGKKGKSTSLLLLSFAIPSLIHGVYDAIIMAGGSSEELVLAGLTLITWIGYVIALFVVSIILIIKSSRNDYCIVTLPADTVIPAAVPGASAGAVYGYNNIQPGVQYQNPYPSAAQPAYQGQIQSVPPVPVNEPVQTIYKPSVAGTWTCTCGNTNSLNFCFKCGRTRPMVNAAWYCPKCGTLSAYNFCGSCGCPKPAYTVPEQR